MRIPGSTYRLQFANGFGFREARDLTPYLHTLGITDVYASPIFQAKSHSVSGYDVVDPTRLNPELGSREDFDAFVDELQRHDMGVIVDIVPNHMAAHPSNPWWRDVLENGPASPYAPYFDIDWDPESRGREDKLLWPILGDPYGTVLERQELTLGLEERGFVLHYHDRDLPLDPKTYGAIISLRLNEAGQQDFDADTFRQAAGLGEFIHNLPPRTATDTSEIGRRYRDKEELKRRIWKLYSENAQYRAFIDENIRIFNGEPGDPRSFDPLDDLLGNQPYTLSFWRVAREKINYRRFFDIADLVALRTEDPEVFANTHALAFQLLDDGKITGLRVDHVDGLYDPGEYLSRLNERAPNAYLLVEKILHEGESLPEDWPVAGTTGYDFINAAGNVMIDPESLKRMNSIYSAFTGIDSAFEDVLYEQKRRAIEELFAGEALSLGLQLGLLAERDRYAKDLSPHDLRKALIQVTACLRVYRTYTRSFDIRPQDLQYVESAIQEGRWRNGHLAPGVFEFLRRMLLLQCPASLPAEWRLAWRRFVRRWQQFSGPAMAKGMEDTVFYTYNRLISMNEVGGGTSALPLEDFHRFNSARAARSPHAMNAGSTHDTKRAEDVRARIGALAEVPDLWARCLKRWKSWNARCKSIIEGNPAPDANEEIFLYQTLIGAWPLDPADLDKFQSRIQECMLKSMREAKVHTSWSSSNRLYECGVTRFIEAILEPSEDNRFLKDFVDFQQRIAAYGAWSSLSQTLLRIASPGVPDVYQGTDLWDFSLVDPDNRRPVDYARRKELLDALPGRKIGDLLENWRDGAVKLYVLWKGLAFRNGRREVFETGDYVPLSAAGKRAGHVVSFARCAGPGWAVAVAPRFSATLAPGGNAPIGRRAWRDTELCFPENAPARWSNIFTGEILKTNDLRKAPLHAILRKFPVALLTALPD